MIEHTLLKSSANEVTLTKLCDEAVENGFFGVCVNPLYVKFCHDYLVGKSVKVVTVIGFPLGENKTETKVYEAKSAICDGADEIDMVITVSKLKSQDYDYVYKDIKAVKDAIGDINLKVILETGTLTDDEIIKASEIAMKAGADFIKTSTGFVGGGASVNAVRLMKQTVGNKLGIKASGGIRDKAFALELVNAGATRLGTSSGVEICK